MNLPSSLALPQSKLFQSRIGILILLLCGADALLTLTLISRGAVEVNPVMDPLVRGSGQSFALWKFVLTSMGVVILTLLARLRMFGRARVGDENE